MKGEVSKVFSMDYNRLMTLDADSIYSSVLSNSYISSYSSLSHFIVKHTKLSLHALANFIFRFYLSFDSLSNYTFCNNNPHTRFCHFRSFGCWWDEILRFLMLPCVLLPVESLLSQLRCSQTSQAVAAQSVPKYKLSCLFSPNHSLNPNAISHID